jgi:hypothetical protein
VEGQGEVQPDEASQARVKTRPTCGYANPRRAEDRWRGTWRRAWFEGKYPSSFWARSTMPESHYVGYAPSEFQKKQWPEEVLLEGWFPPFRRGHVCFDVVEDANTRSSNREWPDSYALADGSTARCAGVVRKPVCTRGLNPGKPRRTCRLGADAYVEEDSGRSGEICLDTSFPRRGRSGTR